MLQNRKILFFLVAFLAFLVDQASKVIINLNFVLNEKFILVKNLFSLEKVFNTGAAFSIFSGNLIFLICVTVLAMSLILFIFFKRANKLHFAEILALAFIFGGALGNLLDRLIYGYVIDFIQCEFINFPIFNCADIFINIGVIIFLVGIFLWRDEK